MHYVTIISPQTTCTHANFFLFAQVGWNFIYTERSGEGGRAMRKWQMVYFQAQEGFCDNGVPNIPES
jgi:hypothetical protein